MTEQPDEINGVEFDEDPKQPDTEAPAENDLVPISDIMEKAKKDFLDSINSEEVNKTTTFPPHFFDTPIDAHLSADMVNHPPHYKGHPKGYECIDVIEDNPYTNLFAAMKYLWRVSWGNKGNKIEDCEKAIWYIQRHIKNLKEGRVK